MRNPRSRTSVSTAVICLLWWLFSAGMAYSETHAAGGDRQIETTTTELLGEEQAHQYRKILSPKKTISWEVYLPRNDSKELPGVLVYISPRASGEIDPRWREVMDRQNLIYIGANESGNRKYTNRRMVLATLAVRALAQQYSFDTAKIIVSGFSGGGRVASLVASQYPEVFTGALYICGVNFWKKSQTPRVERVIQNRFVFLTGTQDFNLRETRVIHERYLEAGAQNSKLMVVQGMGHVHPDADSLTEALEYLLDKDQEPGSD